MSVSVKYFITKYVLMVFKYKQNTILWTKQIIYKVGLSITQLVVRGKLKQAVREENLFLEKKNETNHNFSH